VKKRDGCWSGGMYHMSMAGLDRVHYS
jgi:hypothetical protein